MKGVVPVGRAASWLARVAEKFVGRRKVHVFHTFIVYVHTVCITYQIENLGCYKCTPKPLDANDV